MTAPPSNQGRRRGMKNQDWEIPANLQPDPDDYSFDLERSLKAVVNLKTYVPPDAFTAGTLGTERAGSGVVIRESGLVATIGYLITEAETIWITSSDGRAIPGHALAYDQESGFGLVQALGRLELPALLMGIGSLILQQGDGKGRRLDMNMVVPIGLLTPIMKDLLSYGRVNRPARPWLGMLATEADESIVVG